MKLAVFVMSKCRLLLLPISLLFFLTTVGQGKYEREHRIKKSQFPAKAHAFIEEYLTDARKLRYYRETDSSNISYEAKF